MPIIYGFYSGQLRALAKTIKRDGEIQKKHIVKTYEAVNDAADHIDKIEDNWINWAQKQHGKELIYLASPYTHEDPAVMEERFQRVNKAAGVLLEQGHNIFSPISHFHPIAKAHNLPTEWEFWKRIDEIYISLSKQLWVLTQDGWKTSVGVNAEMEIARSQELQIWLVNPDDFKVTHLFYDPLSKNP